MVHFRLQLEDINLQKKCRMVAPDFRGFGKSRKGKLGEYVKSKDLMEDLHFLIKELNLSKVILCGYSLGGGIALKLSMKYPELVMGIILVSSPPVVARKSFILPIQSKPKYISKKAKKQRYIRRKVWSLFKKHNKRKLLNTLNKKLSKDPDFYKNWSKFEHIPKINIYGKYDSVLPIEHIEFVKEHLPNKRTIALEADHGITHENYKELNSIIENFLVELSNLNKEHNCSS